MRRKDFADRMDLGEQPGSQAGDLRSQEVRGRETRAQQAITPRLGLWDAVSIIIGIVIGTSIFRTAPMVFQNVSTPGWALALWVLGGVVSWCGAVCYAELATTYPRDGGDYVYLSRAFGRPFGFLFAWAQLTVIISGNIGAMAYAFSDYALAIWPAWKAYAMWLTLGPIVALTAINLGGIVAGKSTQNAFSLLKVLGLAAIAAAGLWAGAEATGSRRNCEEYNTRGISRSGHRARVCLIRLRRLDSRTLCGGRDSRSAAKPAAGSHFGNRHHRRNLRCRECGLSERARIRGRTADDNAGRRRIATRRRPVGPQCRQSAR